MGGRAGASPPPHPGRGAGGPGTRRGASCPRLPVRASALTADLSVERGPQVGGALTSLGCRDSGAPGSAGGAGRGALRSPCGREAGCSLVFRGTQPQTRTPREGRGGAGAGAARGGGGGWRLKDSGVWGSGPAPGHRPGASWAPLASRSPARQRAPALSGSGSLHPFPGAPSTSTSPPPPGVGRIPSPSAWLRSPWNFSEERLLRKERTRHKDAEREGGSNGWQVLAQGPVHSPWALRSPAPSRSRLFEAILLPGAPVTTPPAAAAPGTAAFSRAHTQAGESQILVWAFKVLRCLLWPVSQLCLSSSGPTRR